MDKVFADGMKFERPRENAPEWIKGRLSFKVDETINFLTKHMNERGFVNVDLKMSKSGVLYLELNDFKKKEESSEI